MAAPEKEAKGASAKADAAAGAAPATGGGIKALLPVILVVALMPVLAYVTTTFLVIPKIKKAISAATGEPAAAEAHAEPAAGGHGGSGGEHGGGGEKGEGLTSGPGGRLSYPFGKVLVNVAGSLGTRYLLTSFTLVGTDAALKTKVDGSRDQLTDLASSALGSKTIQDLEKPGARNLIRAELISVFNNALGTGLVQELYFTEFAVQ